MSNEKPKIAGPWISNDVTGAYRADLRWTDDWAFGVWESYDPSTGDPLDRHSWTLRWWWCKHRTTGGYCDTKQEAMDAADKYARENGWTLNDAPGDISTTITLSPAESAAFVDLCENPPEPTETLRRCMRGGEAENETPPPPSTTRLV